MNASSTQLESSGLPMAWPNGVPPSVIFGDGGLG
jgi:hypothetical protein